MDKGSYIPHGNKLSTRLDFACGKGKGNATTEADTASLHVLIDAAEGTIWT